MSEPLFIALEGPRGAGKSTIAAPLADALNADLLPTVPPEYQPLRRYLDEHGRSPDARYALFLSALLTAADQIRERLERGRGVVVESYFARAAATHRGYGSTLHVQLPAHVPWPTIYRLECDPAHRARRTAQRAKPDTWWDLLAERNSAAIDQAYTRFPAHRIDTTGRTPAQSLAEILAHKEACTCGHAQPLGLDPHLLPAVSRRAA